jgi:uncharacterized protein (TIGR02145 family)
MADEVYALGSLTGDDAPVTTIAAPVYATDAEGYQYGTVRLGCHCWLSENLRSTQYCNGDPVIGARKYYDARMYPDSNANALTFGLLYTWESAVRPSNSDCDGICPTGWRLPTAEEFFAVNNNYGANDLRSENHWLVPGTNSTKFNALPAGLYSSTSNSFYYLMGGAYFWSTTTVNTKLCKACHLGYGCPTTQIVEINPGFGLSVRCVKK